MREYQSISEIKADYWNGTLRSRPAAVAIARLFPCLHRLYPESYDANEWTPTELAAQSRKMSTGEAECAKFTMMIFNWRPMTIPKEQAASKWKCGVFNIAEAATNWGAAEKQILIEWLKAPFFL